MAKASPYFVETQAIIHRRLKNTIHLLWVVAAVVLLVSLCRAGIFYFTGDGFHDVYFIHQVINSAFFAPYIPTLLYAEKVVERSSRLGVQIMLAGTFFILSSQLVLNGSESLYAFFALPVLMVMAGFFTNARVFNFITLLIGLLLVILTIYDLLGVKLLNPWTQGHLSIRTGLYSLVILFAAYKLVQIMVEDFFTINNNLLIQKKRAEFIAAHDPLTGLYNRYYTEHSFEQFFVNLSAVEKGFVLFLDIDDFKVANTRFGHKGGDIALQVVAKRLSAIAENRRAVACRIGGDEFIVLLICRPQEVSDISQEILNKVAEPFEVMGENMQITCSVGIAGAEQNSNFQEIYRRADTAMHRAKYNGKNTQIKHLQVYTDEEQEHVKILSALRQALKRHEFKLCYQPQIDLSSGRMIGMEALIRWQFEDKELLPGKFISLAEQYGLIHSISAWVIRQACWDCKYLHDQGYTHLSVAVNISAVSLERQNLAETVANSLKESGLPPSSLELELTESALFQQSTSSVSYGQLQQVRHLGVELSIDDFGTGYSNLHYLGQLDMQKLKIDRSFVMQLDEEPNNAHNLVSAIIDIAKRFKLKTVAEGIEDSETLDVLQSMSCDVGQGFHWAKALPIDVMESFLNTMAKTPRDHAHTPA